MEGNCMELALEGERLCKAGDCKKGVQFFENAIQVGTDDLKTLSAIYSQLGNAYFYLQEYGKALEYHKHDLNLARTLGDKLGEAKASGNLGNTLKVLCKFDEAIACCERHLHISRDLKDRIGEARALYNLGNVFHAKGRHAGRLANQDPGEFPSEVKDALQKAAEYYEENLTIVKEVGDRAAQGRACGNLGNTHYLLGNFNQAIDFHQERLSIAKEFGDKSAERRAYSNLGNAHIFLGEFETAADYYKRTLQIASELSDKALEAQACYSLGNTYTLLRDYTTAIQYHVRHLRIAQDLDDRVGEGRACWSLGNAHSALGNHKDAFNYARIHLDISKEVGDETGQARAQMNITDLKKMLGIENKRTNGSVYEDDDSLNRVRRHSMEQIEIMKMTPDKCAIGGARPKTANENHHSADVTLNEHRNNSNPPSDDHQDNNSSMDEQDDFFEMVSKFQSRRIDDQRCSMRTLERGDSLEGANFMDEVNGVNSSHIEDEFLDMLAGFQGSRMNDQRAVMSTFPGLHNSQEVLETLMCNKKEDTGNTDEHFFEILMKCQGNRLEDQRSELPQTKFAPTVPEDDLFNFIQKVQGTRFNFPSRFLKSRSSNKSKKKDKKDKENKK